MDTVHATHSLFPVAEQSAAVITNAAVNAEYKHLIVAVEAPAIDVVAGQFFHLLCPPSDGAAPFLRRPMSVYAADRTRGCVEFLYKVTGAGTRGLATLAPGDRLNVLGPLGRGFTLAPSWRHIAVVGRGVGLATLAPLALMAERADVGVTAILSARRPDLVMSVELFRAHGAEVVVVTDSDHSSDVGNVERLLRDLATRQKADALFTCGSNRLLLLLQRLGKELGIPGQVALEQQMGCALGMCFCCVRDFHAADGGVEHRRVCWEGPVFDLQEPLSW
ncbi:MAG: dihydroorotate dehydrogenase electron transfer subunit [Alphaproteobacteria bacterium]|nr:dihydroorotate dehydrogenase electron transfer subunit [Alphaproteobacteria bacterium]MDE2513382.1 dihydroorotate dehydrogenase electron transfer subunit [Alphaproteobacteria bacterium]